MKNKNHKLINEIQESLSKLDKEDLIFLKDQASVLLYNKEVRIKNATAQEQQKSRKKDQTKKPSDKKVTKPNVYFEQLKNGKFFNLNIKNAKLFMDYNEIKAILKIAKGAETPSEGTTRLFNWFKKERNDVLVDGHIANRTNSTLLLIYKELLKTFQ